MSRRLFLTAVLVLFPLLCFAQASEDEHDLADCSLLASEGRIVSWRTPNLWRIFGAVQNNYLYPCTALEMFHNLFSKMHAYEEKHANRRVEKEKIVGYRVWYNVDPDDDGTTDERQWKMKTVFCDWRR